MSYNMEKREFTLEVGGAPIKLTFESAAPETSIWHYVFSALTGKECPSVHGTDTPIE